MRRGGVGFSLCICRLRGCEGKKKLGGGSIFVGMDLVESALRMKLVLARYAEYVRSILSWEGNDLFQLELELESGSSERRMSSRPTVLQKSILFPCAIAQ